jgi:hypothetical protein
MFYSPNCIYHLRLVLRPQTYGHGLEINFIDYSKLLGFWTLSTVWCSPNTKEHCVSETGSETPTMLGPLESEIGKEVKIVMN